MRRFCFFLICLLTGILPVAAQVSLAFSKPGGFYPETFTLSIEAENGGDASLQIRYTLNGAVPTANSLLYKHPLAMDHTLYSSSNIYKIPNAIPQYQSPIPEEVEHIIVVRAAAFNAAGDRCSEVITASYLIAPLLGRKIQLPVLSLCVDSFDLYDLDKGIFVPGNSFDPAQPDVTGNYYRKGHENEKEGYMEFIDGQASFSQTCGVRTRGNRGRRYTQKGLSLYARKEYGQRRFSPVFEDENFTVKRLSLKPFSCAWTPMGFQDLYCQQLAKYFSSFGSLKARPVVLFLNGEYWGIYFLEEKPDERYLEDHFGVDRNRVSLVEDWAGHNGDGDIDSAFAAMMDWLRTANLSDNRQYEQLSKMVDVGSFTDYVLFETFIGNRDWPANNMRCWSEDGSPWQFIFFDGDAIRTKYFDFVENALYDRDDKTWPTSAEATLLLRRLLQNPNYRTFFVERLDVIHRLFSLAPRVDKEIFEQTVASLKSEIPYQSKRFGFPKNRSSWRQAVRQQRRYWRHRADEVRRAWLQVVSEYNGESCSVKWPVGWWVTMSGAGMAGMSALVLFIRRRRYNLPQFFVLLHSFKK